MRLSALLVRGCAALALVASGWAVAQESRDKIHRHDAVAAEVDAFASAMDEAMRRMMHNMHRPAMGDPDRDFLAMMIPHHQGAIDMARLVLVHGRDPLTRQLAEHILATQAVEIDAMRGRLAGLSALPRDAEYPTLGGTRGDSAPPR